MNYFNLHNACPYSTIPVINFGSDTKTEGAVREPSLTVKGYGTTTSFISGEGPEFQSHH